MYFVCGGVPERYSNWGDLLAGLSGLDGQNFSTYSSCVVRFCLCEGYEIVRSRKLYSAWDSYYMILFYVQMPLCDEDELYVNLMYYIRCFCFTAEHAATFDVTQTMGENES